MVQRGWTEPLDTERLLTEWRWLCPEGLTVIDRNSFGDLFLADGAGRVHRLNVGSGELALIAVSAPTFIQLAKTPEKREEWFEDSTANAARERGLIPGPGQCIGFSAPVVFAESGGLESAYVADLYEHVGFLGDLHRTISRLRDGAKVKLVVQR